MIELEWTIRTVSPLDLRLGVLALLLVYFVVHALNPMWIATNQVLATLPVQRYHWKSETLLSSVPNRITSALASILAMGLLIQADFHTELEILGGGLPSLLGLLALVYLLKFIGIRLFFRLHDCPELAEQLIDYQYGFNMLATVPLAAYLSIDVFAFHQSLSNGDPILIVILLLYFVRGVGIVVLLINKFNYPSIALFIYLCAFELGPLLVCAKVLLLS